MLETILTEAFNMKPADENRAQSLLAQAVSESGMFGLEYVIEDVAPTGAAALTIGQRLQIVVDPRYLALTYEIRLGMSKEHLSYFCGDTAFDEKELVSEVADWIKKFAPIIEKTIY